MPRLKCPQCQHVFTPAEDVDPVCPNCNYAPRRTVGRRTSGPVPGRPPTAPSPVATVPAYPRGWSTDAPSETGASRVAAAALVLGILAPSAALAGFVLVLLNPLFVLLLYAALAFGVAALIVGIIGRRRAIERHEPGEGMAMGGMVLGAVVTGLYVLVIFLSMLGVTLLGTG